MTDGIARILSFPRWAAAAILIAASGWAGAAGATECPDPNGSASGINLVATQLATSTRDFAARYVAGDLTYGTCPDVISVGNFNRNPSVSLSLTGTFAGGSLSLNLRTNDDQCDPVVLVSTPDGQWYNDDDAGSSIGRHWDALIDVPTTRDGVYRIWLGHYRQGETCEGTLRIGYGRGDGTAPPASAPYSEWFPITNDPGQFIAQPGNVMPLPVNPGPYYTAGTYDIYTADAGTRGFGPFTGIVRRSVTLDSNRRYVVDLGGVNGFSISLGEAQVLGYSEPGAGNAIIYARNGNRQTWRAICVLPTGAPISRCGAGGQTVYSEWTAITNDQRQFSTQPANVFPMSTCDRATGEGSGDFPVGTYDIYVGSAGDHGYLPPTGVRRFTVTLASNSLYAVDLGGVNGFSISANRAGMNMYREPNDGFARIYHRNSNITSWRAICVLPTGWAMSWCDLGVPYPCAGPSDHAH